VRDSADVFSLTNNYPIAIVSPPKTEFIRSSFEILACGGDGTVEQCPDVLDSARPGERLFRVFLSGARLNRLLQGGNSGGGK
jgi:hypothetical protein